jgi:hypothetical protein
LQLDHVLIAVADLAAATARFEAEHGLASVEGGRHPGWGTANRIVPLGDAYLELIAVVDEDEAAASEFGRWVARGAAGAGRLLGWAVRPEDLDAVVRRLDLVAHRGARAGADGSLVRWRSAGLEAAAAEPSLPFFLEWAPGTSFPGRSAAPQPASIARLALRGDPERLSSWLGPHTLPVTIDPGPPAITGLVLAGPRGCTVIGRREA